MFSCCPDGLPSNRTLSPRQIMRRFSCSTASEPWFIEFSCHFCQRYMTNAPDKLSVISAGFKAISSEHAKRWWTGSIWTLPWQMSLGSLAAIKLEYWVMYYMWMLHFIIKPPIRAHHSFPHMYVRHRYQGKCDKCGAWHPAGTLEPIFLRGVDFCSNTVILVLCNTCPVFMDISVYLKQQLSALANPSAWFKCQYLLHMCTSINLYGPSGWWWHHGGQGVNRSRQALAAAEDAAIDQWQ